MYALSYTHHQMWKNIDKQNIDKKGYIMEIHTYNIIKHWFGDPLNLIGKKT
jgi:hypothetical protein